MKSKNMFCLVLTFMLIVVGCETKPATSSDETDGNQPGPLNLVDNGICKVSIHNVAAGAPSPVEAYAAQQLQKAFQLATRVTPPINPASPAKIEIRLGVADRFNTGVENLDEQAYVLRRTTDDHIELAGNSRPAVIWAVADFCKEVLNISWPIANDIMSLKGPPKSIIAIERLHKVQAPDFAIRGWIIGDNADGYHYNDKIGNWMAHNRQNTLHNRIDYMHQGGAYKKMSARGIDAETTGHTFEILIPASIYYDDVNHPESYHPEYFPLIDGERVRPAYASLHLQLCLSNPDIRDIMIEKITKGFADYPDTEVFGVGQNDGSGGWCQCDNCAAMDDAQASTGVYSNRLIHFINSLAEAIGHTHPGRCIGTFATGPPPDFDVADNVAVTFVLTMEDGNFLRKLTDPNDPGNAAIMANLTGWLNRSKNVHFWAHYWTTGMDFCITPYARTTVEAFNELKTLGLKGICGETKPSYWPSLRFFSYAVARAGWDNSLAFDEILDDYCHEAYGPAASQMKSFYLLYESRIYERVPFLPRDGAAEQLFPTAFSNTDLNRLDSYLTSAEVAAAGASQGNIDAIAEARTIFEKFKSISIDPADIPGIGPNLVRNPGAESGPEKWTHDIYQALGDYSFSTPGDNAHTGGNSFRIECTGKPGQAARWLQSNIPVTPGKRYAARFWVRAGDGAYGRLEIYTPQCLYVGWQDSSDQWVRIVLPEFTATSSTISLYPTSNGSGTVYFDDFFIAELPK